MLKTLFAVSLLLAQLQEPLDPKVNRIYVQSPYRTDIIYEYANASIPENQPIKEVAIACLIAELEATGLFSEVRVTQKLLKKGQKVDVFIEPTWNPQRENFVIDEIVFEDFIGIDEAALRRNLRQSGFTVGASLQQFPISKMRAVVLEATKEIYKDTPMMQREVEKRVSNLSFRMRLVAPEKAKLIIAPGHRNLCP